MSFLEIKDVSKAFGANQAIIKASFNVDSGKVVGLLGPNGAGKTSMMRMLNHILVPDEGKILIDNEILSEKHLKRIGYLPEERGLYTSEKVLPQLIYFGRLRGMDKKTASLTAKNWLEKFQITNWANKRIETLSKGMAQKVQFIATVIHNPDLLILDEPFSGFDPLNIELIRNEIKQFKQEGKTIIISTHNMNEAEELCDNIILINKGQIVLNDSINEIREKFSDNVYTIRFKGNMIAFANALWTGYELLDKTSLNENTHIAQLKMKHENNLTSFVKAMEGQVNVEEVSKYKASMHSIFLKVVDEKEEVKNNDKGIE